MRLRRHRQSGGGRVIIRGEVEQLGAMQASEFHFRQRTGDSRDAWTNIHALLHPQNQWHRPGPGCVQKIIVQHGGTIEARNQSQEAPNFIYGYRLYESR